MPTPESKPRIRRSTGKPSRPKKEYTIQNGEKKKNYRTLADCTPKQQAFLKYYGNGESVYAAAVRAGYSGTGAEAYELMKVPSFAALAQAQRQANADAIQMTRERVMNGLVEAAEMAKLMAEPSSMVAAWREIGKMSGFYAPVETRIKVEGNITLDKMNRLTDAELLEIVKPVTEKLSYAVHSQEVQDAEQIASDDDGQDD